MGHSSVIKDRIFVFSAAFTISLLVCMAARAGTVFSPQQAGERDFTNHGEYPPSSFGQPPENGFSQGFAAREAMDMDAPDEESGRAPGASRGLASVGDSPISMTQSAPVRAGTREVPASVVSRRGVQEVSVIASDLGYFPKTIFVSRSVPVRMYVTGASKNTLCIMMDSFGVRKQVKADKIEEITFIPNVPGTYRFYCPVNGMEGNLVVKEFSTPFQLSDLQTSQDTEDQRAPTEAPVRATTSARRPASERYVPSVQAQWSSPVSAIDPSQ